MAEIVRVNCDWCGTIELNPNDVVLDLAADRFIYECPLCESRFSRDATPRVRSILEALGCPTVNKPPPITEPEIQAFVDALERDW